MAARRYEFGEFQLNTQNYELVRAGRPVRLEKIPFDLLVLLLERRETLVSREEIIAALWGADTIQDVEQSLNTAIRKVRLALRDSPNEPRFVQTVVGRGYRFIASVNERDAVEPPRSAPMPEEVPVPAPASNGAHPGKARKAILFGAGVVALLMAVWWSIQDRREGQLVAVLPFQDLNGDPGRMYFSRGITEEVITQLGRAAPVGFGVIAGPSVWRYGGKTPAPGQLIAELGVGYVLTGSVAWEGRSVRVSARLIRARDGLQLWADAFDGSDEAVLALQQDVAASAARALHKHLGTVPARSLTRQPPLDAEAADLYLRGRFYWNQRTEVSLRQAIAYFRQSLARAPANAPAYAAMADCYAALVYGCHMAPVEGFQQARAALRRARELDPEAPEVFASEGYVSLYFDWDLKAARKNLESATNANPNYATAYDWLGVLSTASEDFPRARAAFDLARRLDPASLPIQTNMGFHLHYSGHNKEAEQSLRDVLRRDANFPLAHFWMGRVLSSQGDCPSALVEMEAASGALRDWQPLIAADGYIAGVCGKPERARENLRRLENLSRSRFVTSYGMALIHTGLGDKEEALIWLRKALEERSHWLIWIRLDPRFHMLRDDARFQSLVKAVFPHA